MQDAYEEANLYCAAFNFPLDEEVHWLLSEAERIIGRRVTSVLEPMCGNGRYGTVFANAGLHYHGFDCSSDMMSLSESKSKIHLSCADARSFEIPGDAFDLGWCPINSIRHLSKKEDIHKHLECMRGHLVENGLYVLEVNFIHQDGPMEESSVSWQVDQPDGSVVKAKWWGERCELSTNRMWEGALFEREIDGKVVEKVESEYEMLMGSTEDWKRWIRAAGFHIDQVVANGFSSREAVDFTSDLDNNTINHYLFLRPQR